MYTLNVSKINISSARVPRNRNSSSGKARKKIYKFS